MGGIWAKNLFYAILWLSLFTTSARANDDVLFGAELEMSSKHSRYHLIAPYFDYTLAQARFGFGNAKASTRTGWLNHYVNYPGAFQALPAEVQRQLLGSHSAYDARNPTVVGDVQRAWRALSTARRTELLQVNHFPAAEQGQYLHSIIRGTAEGRTRYGSDGADPQRLPSGAEAAMALLRPRGGRNLPAGWVWHRDRDALEISHGKPVAGERAFLQSLEAMTRVLDVPIDNLNNVTHKPSERVGLHIHFSAPMGAFHEERLKMYNMLTLARLAEGGHAKHAVESTHTAYDPNPWNRGLVRVISVADDRFHFEVRMQTRSPKDTVAELQRWFVPTSSTGSETAMREMAAQVQTALAKSLEAMRDGGVTQQRIYELIEFSSRHARPADIKVSIHSPQLFRLFPDWSATLDAARLRELIRAAETSSTARESLRHVARGWGGNDSSRRAGLNAAIASHAWTDANRPLLLELQAELFQRLEGKGADVVRRETGDFLATVFRQNRPGNAAVGQAVLDHALQHGSTEARLAAMRQLIAWGEVEPAAARTALNALEPRYRDLMVEGSALPREQRLRVEALRVPARPTLVQSCWAHFRGMLGM